MAIAIEEEESVDAAVAARRERLRSLRAAQELLNTPDQDELDTDGTPRSRDAPPTERDDDDEAEEGQGEEEDNNLSMKFRNYLPHDKQLQEGKLAAPVLPKFEDPVETAPPPQDKKEDPFLNIAPKKPNWDLRRDVQKKLNKLEKRTQKAMFQLMEEEEKKRRMVEDGENGD